MKCPSVLVLFLFFASSSSSISSLTQLTIFVSIFTVCVFFFLYIDESSSFLFRFFSFMRNFLFHLRVCMSILHIFTQFRVISIRCLSIVGCVMECADSIDENKTWKKPKIQNKEKNYLKTHSISTPKLHISNFHRQLI